MVEQPSEVQNDVLNVNECSGQPVVEAKSLQVQVTLKSK